MALSQKSKLDIVDCQVPALQSLHKNNIMVSVGKPYNNVSGEITSAENNTKKSGVGKDTKNIPTYANVVSGN